MLKTLIYNMMKEQKQSKKSFSSYPVHNGFIMSYCRDKDDRKQSILKEVK